MLLEVVGDHKACLERGIEVVLDYLSLSYLSPLLLTAFPHLHKDEGIWVAHDVHILQICAWNEELKLAWEGAT